ncbi:MAG: NFACT family protein [Clostridia bacterium]|jgi:predicted ribosome quality control (RQC) complex YloA/Tae2 family protein|nr:NFACT family protein [Clostridia bacterium]
MALDGIVVSAITAELKNKIIGGRIDKIYQPFENEIIFNIRTDENLKLLVTTDGNYPRLHLTDEKRKNPEVAPSFCMLLRKHLSGAKIINITQPNFERIVEIHVETKNELGDLVKLRIITEIMGKHSNLIIVNEENKILDSLKRISFTKSSVREILPGKIYSYPPSQNKLNPIETDYKSLYGYIYDQVELNLSESIYKSLTGFSPIISNNICDSLNLKRDSLFKVLDIDKKEKFINEILGYITRIKENDFNYIITKDEKGNYLDFLPFKFNNQYFTEFNSISELMDKYYSEKDIQNKLKQVSSDTFNIIKHLVARTRKKLNIYKKDLDQTKNMDNYKIKGELITANIHALQKGMDKLVTLNYYDELAKDITINLDVNLSPSENAQKYFAKYNKMKRAKEKMLPLIAETSSELLYLESLLYSIESASTVEELNDIKEELILEGYVKNRSKGKKKKSNSISKPEHYISSDGTDIYVGKNNKQNDELTLKFAGSYDIWLHTKDIPGSHVIIRSDNPSDETLLEAANLAAYNSKAKESSKVPVDYTHRKYVKKPNGAKPGMVIYTDNKTIYVTPNKNDIDNLTKK